MIAALLLAAATASSGYDGCIAGIDHRGFVKSQMLDCATRAMNRADTALNLRYRAVMARLGPARRLRLRAEERIWIERRRTWCRAAGREAMPSPEINRMLCLVRQTDARIVELAVWKRRAGAAGR